MKLQTLLLGALIGLLLVGNVITTHNLLTAPYPGHNDFLTPWEAARSYWVDGLPVYSDQSNINIQTRIYGRPIEDGEFPNYFAYPFYTVFVMWPLVLLPYAWASAVWMVVLETLLIASLLLLLNLYRWRPRPLMLAFLIVWMLLFYPSARGLILGQVSHLVFFLEVLAIWALVRERQSLAGAALALSAIKPQMGYLIIPFLLLWGLRERRWRFVGTFSAGFALLLVGSFVLQPSWVGDWLAEIGRYTSYTAVGSPVWVIAQYYLGSGATGEWAINLIFYGLVLWAWWQVIAQRREDRWLWAVMLMLTVTHLVAPRTATTHFVVMVAPLAFYFALLSRRGRGLWLFGLLIALLVIPWVHFLMTVDGEFEHPATYLLLPFGTAALLLATRGLWGRAPKAVT